MRGVARTRGIWQFPAACADAPGELWPAPASSGDARVEWVGTGLPSAALKDGFDVVFEIVPV
jgi:hypothetical protein